MSDIMIFGGTTEGRELAAHCAETGRKAFVYVVSSYGKDLLPESPWLMIRTGAMGENEMEAAMKQHDPSMVFDATHPYAAEASENIRNACKSRNVPYYRVGRRMADSAYEDASEVLTVSTVGEAVSLLSQTEGNILLTTGSKELAAFTALDHYEERIYARVLPSSAVMETCEKLGIKGKHLIGMQGPFQTELNMALLRQFSIRYLVTKESGTTGGFEEKMEAADRCSVTAVVIGRPVKEEGIPLEQAKKLIGGIPGEQEIKRRVSLIGTGMGGAVQMTLAALRTLQECQVVFGSPRMLKLREELGLTAVTVPEYLGDRIIRWLKEHPQYERTGVLYSGDTGFYSGAEGFVRETGSDEECANWEISVYPGISTLSYLCARLKTGWEDVKPMTLHGRDADLLSVLSEHGRVFTLLGGKWDAKELCGFLYRSGLINLRVTVGQNLSYPEERIVQGTPGELMQLEFSGIHAALIERIREKGEEEYER